MKKCLLWWADVQHNCSASGTQSKWKKPQSTYPHHAELHQPVNSSDDSEAPRWTGEINTPSPTTGLKGSSRRSHCGARFPCGTADEAVEFEAAYWHLEGICSASGNFCGWSSERGKSQLNFCLSLWRVNLETQLRHIILKTKIKIKPAASPRAFLWLSLARTAAWTKCHVLSADFSG